jgi:hypothetical protein
MGVHLEEGSFVVRISLSAEFGEDYEGDEDGYVWLEAWRTGVRPALLRAILAELRAAPRFEAFPVSRGKSPDEELEIAVRFQPSAPNPSADPKNRH